MGHPAALRVGALTDTTFPLSFNNCILLFTFQSSALIVPHGNFLYPKHIILK